MAGAGGYQNGCVQDFLDDEASYTGWLRAHPRGYVVNAERTPSKRYLKLHAAVCPTISQLTGKGTNFTRTYRKVCATDVRDLQAWARSLGGELQPCARCGP